MSDFSNKTSVATPAEGTPEDINFQQWGFDAHPVISPLAGGLLVLFVVLLPFFSTQAEVVLMSIKTFITEFTDWFYVLATNIYLGVVIYLAFGKLGKVRLGGPTARPEFSTLSWYAMLVSAGMGIGLMFWSVAEPIYHFEIPPSFQEVVPGTPLAAKQALSITFFHWGLHPWGVYALVGLALAFFHFNCRLPLTISSIFYPLLKDKIYKWPGYLIDSLAVLATMSGLATSLGSGAEQLSSGFHFLFDWPDTITIRLILVGVITLISALSVASGLSRGVKLLSEVNLYLSAGLILFVLVVGPTKFILDSFVEDLGYYISTLPALSFWTEAFSEDHWQANWTLFYWGWWIAWSPFVGTFIGRVSKGRTIQEFVFGVLIVPSLLSFFWMSVFGGTALSLELQNIGNLSEVVMDNVATSLFVMLAQFPLAQISSMLSLILVVTFFVTSCNSGALVVNYLSSGGKLESPIPQRIFWVVLEGSIAAVLLVGGGLTALQTASIAMGLPFAVVLLVMCYSLYRGLTQAVEDSETPASPKVIVLSQWSNRLVNATARRKLRDQLTKLRHRRGRNSE